MATLVPNQPAPDFTLSDQYGNSVRLSDFQGKWVVLYFYPKDMTPGCTQEACSFRDMYREFAQAGIVVLGVSADDTESHRKFTEKYDLPYPLLADTDHSVSEAYGAWHEKRMYGKKFWGVDRITYIIDPEGIIRKVFSKVKPASHGDEVYSAIMELRGDG